MDGSASYVVTVAAKGVRARVLFNDWPAARVLTDDLGTQAQKLNPMVVEGSNVLRVLVSPSPSFPDIRPPLLDVRLTKGVHGELEGALTLFQLGFQREAAALAPDGETELARHELVVARAFGRWAWEDAPPFDARERAAVLDALRELHAALVARDHDRFITLNELKLTELARATGRDPRDVVQRQRDWIRGLMTCPDWGVGALALDHLELESCAGGRIVEAWMPGYRSPLRLLLFGSPMELDVSLSRIDGRWQAIR